MALLNDCKYGYSFQDSDIELSLLRSPDYPAENCDRGVHSFTYWLYPHVGDYREGKVAIAGYEVNVQQLVQRGKARQEEGSYITTDCENIIIDTLKPSEDGKSMILRFLRLIILSAEVRFSFILQLLNM